MIILIDLTSCMLQSRQRSMIKRTCNPEEQRPEVMNFGYKPSITSSTMFSSLLVNITIWCPATWSVTSHRPRSNRRYTFTSYLDPSLNSTITFNYSILEKSFNKCYHQVVPVTCDSCRSYPSAFTHTDKIIKSNTGNLLTFFLLLLQVY